MSPCPEKEQLQAFVSGSCSEAEIDEIGDHLEDCTQCNQLVVEIEAQTNAALQKLQNIGNETEQIDRNETGFKQSMEVAINTARQQGEFIGPYELVRLIGFGGMGEVWEARQTEPLKRTVALKLIKPTIAAQQALVRFKTERNALAAMDHPNIARVFDAGESSFGDLSQPYFVMEYVENALPLNQYCDEHQLPPNKRLELFRVVCQAVQHAHQRLVIHRDLKPTNILVTEVDGEPFVKIIDFGLAKALKDEELNEQKNTLVELSRDVPLEYAFTTVVGTPTYMSPEQATEGEIIGTKTDIYSLGAILYELLTGNTPIDRESLRKAVIDEVFDVIRQQSTIRPSERLSSVNAAVTEVCRKRDRSPTSLRKYLLGELDWVVMKSISKRPADRYDSAAELSDEIGRFLQNDPLKHFPTTWRGYETRKFIQKHFRLFAAVALVIFALIGGAAYLAWSGEQFRQQNEIITGANTLLTEKQTEIEKKVEQNQEQLRLASRIEWASGREAMREYSIGLNQHEYRTTPDGHLLWKKAAAHWVRALEFWPENQQVSTSLYNALMASRLRGEREPIATINGKLLAVNKSKNVVAVASQLNGDYYEKVALWLLPEKRLLAQSNVAIPKTGGFVLSNDGMVLMATRFSIANFAPAESIVWNANTNLNFKIEDEAHLSPSGDWIVSIDNEQSVQKWNCKTGQATTLVAKDDHSLGGARFSPGGEYFLTKSKNEIHLHDVNDLNATRWLQISDQFASAAFSPDSSKLAIQQKDNTAQLYHTTTMKSIVGDIPSFVKRLSTENFNRNSSSFVTVDGKSQISILKKLNETELKERETRIIRDGNLSKIEPQQVRFYNQDQSVLVEGAKGGGIVDVATRFGVYIGYDQIARFDTVNWVQPSNSRLAVSPDGGTFFLQIPGKEEFAMVNRLQMTETPLTLDFDVNRVEFSPDGSAAMICSRKQTTIWDCASVQPLGNIPDTAGAFQFFTQSGFHFATASESQIHFWRTAEESLPGHILADNNQPYVQRFLGLNFDPSSTRLATSAINVNANLARNSSVRLWNLKTKQPYDFKLPHDYNYWQPLFTSNGEMLQTIGRAKAKPGAANQWSVKSGERVGPKLSAEKLFLFTLSPNGETAIKFTNDGEAVILDAMSQKPRGEPISKVAKVSDLEYETTGDTIIAVHADGCIRRWRAKNVTQQARSQKIGEISGMLLSDDDSTIAALTRAGSAQNSTFKIHLLNASTLKAISVIKGDELSRLKTLVFANKEGSKLVSQGIPGVCLWDTTTGELLYRNDDWSSGKIERSRGTAMVLHIDIAGSLSFVNPNTLERVGSSLSFHDSKIRDAQISHDGKKLAVVSSAPKELTDRPGKIRIYSSPGATRLPPESLIRVFASPWQTNVRPPTSKALHAISQQIGLTFDQHNELAPVESEGSKNLAPANDQWGRLIQWMQNRSPLRSIHPETTQTVRNANRRNSELETEFTLQEILRNDPQTPLVRLRLANVVYKKYSDDSQPQNVAALSFMESQTAFLRQFDLNRLPDDSTDWATAAKLLAEVPLARVGNGETSRLAGEEAIHAAKRAKSHHPETAFALSPTDLAGIALEAAANGRFDLYDLAVNTIAENESN